ncbi:hypothetical protein ACH40E_22055 [Streptomyces acidicola]|uniref:hypothetical protein n=1 Tax=Streptomyces acidicola TaxID=2596892 RepID=UPI0037B942EE
MDSGKVTRALLDRLAAERDRIDQRITDLLTVRDRPDDVIAIARKPGPGCTHVP